MPGSTYAYLADRNEVQNGPLDNPATIASSAAWALTAPLTSMLTTPVSDRAVCLTKGDVDYATGAPINPVVVTLTWQFPIFLSVASLLDTNLRQNAFYRMEAFGDAGMTELVATSVVDGVDANVVPPLTDPETMPAGAPNQMRGDLDPRDFALLPTNIHCVVPQVPVVAIRWTLWGGAFRPDSSEDTGYRIGLAWAGDGLIFSRHVGKSGEGVKDNDEVITGSGGSAWVEEGIAKRTVTIGREVTDRKLRDELFKMALRSGKRRPLLYLPSIGDSSNPSRTADPAANFLYGGLYRRSSDHSQSYVSSRYTSTSIELEEFKE
ncbi:hypothetical protein J2848_005625 [Azospirillum lipoferum]|uniref:Uncharacterized protein n=1 Tax=Azospirillum lipoferum TaxID=193 RepID=A0A5A9GH29_AZOLI|nr:MULTISPECIES: hypothetical protein [Azospirillum]KAA0593014.1 hypothetical protein FZ942_26185 [Azospirillum lipoferum]MCP1613924.1 hypothetical protein [Azospirillum lipoferum]MDW5537681.1 hypothetical protein [Azospirillum sp. NL1]